ncbi:nitroreductase family deazaflavin-dependent oxidoreductase [Nakamurella lactea]|uniref:nitroreductase family deazaflavin-dependent oxidoreductase n=1 Tax=Nakamurella lactea TaxID=459515 RepID=UPI000414C501|nr:nitroreductase family deazaflavin-dependent oxidoreductase [Nakamurella lactea]
MTTDATATPSQQFEPNATPWVRKQLEKIDATGTTRSVDVLGSPVMVLTMIGAKSGKPRRVPLMRVEHDGVYAAVASKGGAPEDPVWVRNIVANPDLTVQDGTEHHELRARLATPEERELWWPRCVAAYPSYAEYQTKTDRQIPVFLLEPR